jgi:hypothetical protein
MTKRHVRPPHIIRLPKGAVSPTGSIYKEFDIISQGRVLNTYPESRYVIRSLEPFVLRAKVNGEVKEFKSKKEGKS